MSLLMKYFLAFILSMTVANFISQLISDNPYEVNWNYYFLDFDSSFVSSFKIKKITSEHVKMKRDKEKRERNDFTIEFNEHSQPLRYIHYHEFGLRNDYRYNPIWRIFNEYPIYYIKEYDFVYDNNHKLTEIIETEKNSSHDIEIFHKRSIEYDTIGRMNLQRHFEFYNSKFGPLDTIFENHIDSFSIIYSNNNSGSIIYNYYYQDADTSCWTGTPYKLYNYYVANSNPPLLRNNLNATDTSKIFHKDKYAEYVFDADGLIYLKGYNIDLKKYEATRREYEYW